MPLEQWEESAAAAQAVIDGLGIPWSEIEISQTDVEDGNLMLLSKRLAVSASFIVRLNGILTPLLAKQHAATEMLDHAVAARLAQQETDPKPEDSPKRKPARDMRAAYLISHDERLRALKISIINLDTTILTLEQTRDSLDLLWRTTSRLISARAAEPIDR